MPTKYEKSKTYGQVVDDMATIKDEAEAKQYFEDVVLEAMAHKLTREEAVKRAQMNLGYLMGYAPTRIDCAMWEKIGASHPIFGSMADGVKMTTKEILEVGIAAGEKAKES